MIIGLTGGIGSGKTTVCEFFKELGVPTTNADLLGREILENDSAVFKTIQHKFPDVITDNIIDRTKLRKTIFMSQSDRVWLEELMHPLIKQKIKDFAKSNTSRYCVIEIPLLFEANWLDCIDRALVIDTTEDLQIERTIVRDKLPADAVKKVMDAQLTRAERLSKRADILTNNGDLTALKLEVAKLHEKYLALSTPKNQH